ncbi:MAG: DEAD/DEAH box helicase [Nitrospirae bacterium]|nr:DEAD/DEAH box helicase [Nitrospirota bacterium]
METGLITLNNFKNTYRQLSSLEKTVLQMLSIIYEPVNIATIEKCLIASRIKDKNITDISANLKNVLHKLHGLEITNGTKTKFDVSSELIKNEATSQAAKDNVIGKMATAVQKVLPVREFYYNYPSYPLRIIREIRIGFYTHDIGHVQDYLQLGWSDIPEELNKAKVFQRIFNNPFNIFWFKTLPVKLQALALEELIEDAIANLEPLDDYQYLLAKYIEEPNREDYRYILSLLATVYMFKGKLDEAYKVVNKDRSTVYAQSVLGLFHLLKGEPDKSIAEYEIGLKLLQRVTRKRNIFLSNIIGLFFLIAKLKKNDTEYVYKCSSMADNMPYYRYDAPLAAIMAMCYSMDGKHIRADDALSFCRDGNHYRANGSLSFDEEAKSASYISDFFYCLSLYSVKLDIPQAKLQELFKMYRKALQNGYTFLAMDMASLLSIFIKDQPELEDFIRDTKERTGITGVVSLLKLDCEPWERSLSAITDLFQTNKSLVKAKDTVQKESRLVWQLNLSDDSFEIIPKEQNILKDGTWAKGKRIASKRLYEAKPGDIPFMTEHDMRICSTIMGERRYNKLLHYFDWERAIIQMIDHPLLFSSEYPYERIELIKGVPELIVDKTKTGYSLKISPYTEDENVIIVKDAANKYKVVEIKEEHRKLYVILGTEGLKVPPNAKDKVLQAISGLSSIVQVHSSMDLNVENAQEVLADARPHVRLVPFGIGLKVEVTVRPFSDAGPYFKPAIGGVNLLVEIDGKLFQTHRDFELEKKNVLDMIQASSVLTDMEHFNREWLIDDPEKCFQLLIEIKAFGEEVFLEWPEGKKYDVVREVSFDNLRISVKREADWFSLSGEVTLDENNVIVLKKLLELLDGGESRFVKIDEGKYLALTREFKKRLEEIKVYSDKHSQSVRIHPLAAIALDDFFESVKSLDSDSEWKDFTQRVSNSVISDKNVPSTLQAELRDYQVEGFKWLSKLSDWGAGACLADDMGLGKTLEALAAILDRASGGPSLVVVPTSVLSNWQKEVDRFAPTFNVIVFGGKERKQILDELKPNDLLLCTYGLLQSEVEMLWEVQWQTIVLDEAQAIKNFATKRSQAAMGLKGGFKVITTGTPIENHLGELWNLFNFINPGLLGSLDKFNHKFAIPIEKYGNRDVRKRLKKLIQPFLLRRTKSQVLEELPSRTEIVLEVEMSEEEASFYEALRQKAIERIETSGGEAGQKLISILAELMKLRRACCNALLVSKDIQIPSSKLNLFAEVLEELLDNKHKVLVFSQFVDHLNIIRQYLNTKSISYQYLDGSTPLKERAKAVDDFQSGKGDVFLISIRAGGFGLNLTAADYVIHMDPWWNPAVEAQASDRAHRIGQKRPVTIYKLITKNTIEEKIVKLHEDKKELANSLLEGSELSSKISAEDLIALIKDI